MTEPVDQAIEVLDDSGTSPLGRQFADLNHNLRTSMNSIAGMLTMLRDTNLSDSQREYAAVVQNKLDTLLDLTERVVDMSLLEANRFALARTPFDLRPEIQGACLHKIAAARIKGVQLHLDEPPSVLVEGDPARLRQLVSMLVNGTIRLSEQSNITITTQAKCENGACDVRIQLHAPGLFDIGERLVAMLNQETEPVMPPRSTAAVELALCVQLAKLMGGRIGISNLPQQGTSLRLSLSLPLAPNPAADMRTLLVSEASPQREALAAMLTALGMRVQASGSAVEALKSLAAAKAAQDPFRVVMLDRWIEGMDGELLGAAIKADAAYWHVALVLLDEQAQPDQASLTLSGFSASFVKPELLRDATALLRLCEEIRESKPSPVSANASGTTSTPEDKGARLPFAGRRILIAEDNPVNQQVTLRMLEKFGCQADLADNGQRAVDMHREVGYDLILMDCDMPVMDGFEATQTIRSLQGNGRRTPIVALTASTAQDERDKCLASDMDDFISKPIRPQLLQETLARWLPAHAAAEPEPMAAPCADELEYVHDAFGADFRELAALYQNDAPPRLALLRQSHACGDHVLFAKTAHALGGSSASIGASGLSAMCRDLEMLMKSGARIDFERRMNAIEAEFRRISGKLQSMLS
ncbi:response regulator [Noviherbaspirillum sp.]|uniref:response regulator n=1 Tax=Noviherbaspirillum sp. TaxID=1926288 RepID=UPI002B48E096|nr:response regulator [Noviherbaspirillum sp.]HJV80033.1 response regulator [Noviherbaspirillum sp.]